MGSSIGSVVSDTFTDSATASTGVQELMISRIGVHYIFCVSCLLLVGANIWVCALTAVTDQIDSDLDRSCSSLQSQEALQNSTNSYWTQS